MAKQKNNNYQIRRGHLVIHDPLERGYTIEVLKEKLRLMLLVYFCFAFELTKKGILHVHIYFVRKSPVRFSTLKRMFPEAHIEPAFGSSTENRDYLKKHEKEDKSDDSIEGTFYEEGELPATDSNPSVNEEIMEMLSDGLSISEVIQKYPKFSTRIRQLEDLEQLYLKENYMAKKRAVEVYYITCRDGSDGIDAVYELFGTENVCEISDYDSSGIFDSYESHPVLVLNDYHSDFSIQRILRLMSGKPCTLPARFHNRIACFTDLFIISDVNPEGQYSSEEKRHPALYQKFFRSIDHFCTYKNNKLFYLEKGDNYYEN